MTMRLLLLLSALLSALSGVVGQRVQAQPAVSASVASAPIASTVVVGTVRPVRRSDAIPSLVIVAGRLVSAPSVVVAAVRRRLFAERRRE